MDDEQSVHVLLERAADLGVIEAPAAAMRGGQGASGSAGRTRRAGARVVLAVVAAVLMVAAVAVGVRTVASRTGDDHSSTTTGLPDEPVPATTPQPTVTARQLAAYRWRAMPAAPIPVRTQAAQLWTGTQLFVWGGAIGNNQRNDGALYNPATRHWTTLPTSPLSARSGALVTLVGNAVIVWGGSSNASSLADGARYDLGTERWSELPPAPGIRGAQAGLTQLVTVGGFTMLMGTVENTNSRAVHADLYDPRLNRWFPAPTLRTRAREYVTLNALGFGTSAYLWPDWSRTVATSKNSTESTSGVDAYRFDLSTDSWRTTKVRPDTGVDARGAQWTGSQILFPETSRYCGSCTGPELELVTSLLVDPRTDSRTRVPAQPRAAGGDTVLWTGAALLSCASYASTKAGVGSAWDPATRRWTPLSDPRTPRREDQSPPVWAGRVLLEWGLLGLHSAVGTGGLEFVPPT